MSNETRKKIEVGIVVSTVVVMALCLVGLLFVFWGGNVLALVGNTANAIVLDQLDATETYELVVDYDQPLAEAIAEGHYDFVNENIVTENFPPEEHGIKAVKAKLLHFDRQFSNGDEALAEIYKLGYRPGNLREFLVLHKNQPKLINDLTIATLGSTLFDPDGDRRFVCIGGGSGLRRLLCGSFNTEFGIQWQFLVVPETLDSLSVSNGNSLPRPLSQTGVSFSII